MQHNTCCRHSSHKTWNTRTKKTIQIERKYGAIWTQASRCPSFPSPRNASRRKRDFSFSFVPSRIVCRSMKQLARAPVRCFDQSKGCFFEHCLDTEAIFYLRKRTDQHAELRCWWWKIWETWDLDRLINQVEQEKPQPCAYMPIAKQKKAKDPSVFSQALI